MLAAATATMASSAATATTSGGGGTTTSTSSHALIICDVQPDILRKLPNPRLFLDLTLLAISAANKLNKRGAGAGGDSDAPPHIICTLLDFDEGKQQPKYGEIDPNHRRLGVLRRLGEKNPNIKWFTGGELSIAPNAVDGAGEGGTTTSTSTVVSRTTYLPQANDAALIDTLRRCCCTSTSVTVLGYGPTVQSICNLLGDIVTPSAPVRILKGCTVDENAGRCRAYLEHGRLFDEEVMELVDLLEEADMLHERVDVDGGSMCLPAGSPPKNKYVCDAGRGGHLCLFLPYLTRDYGYTEWPTQPWYRENSLTGGNKQYDCPLGRAVVDLCDEPKFTSRLRFFLLGRQHLDEKDLLHELVADLMPPTFDSIASAQAYAAADAEEATSAGKVIWFVKKANQNGGRAVRVTTDLSAVGHLESDDQLQAHVPRPLLYDGRYKFHVKTYQHISCGPDKVWKVYMHDLFYLAVASREWGVGDLSDDAQVTTMRTHRLYRDDAFRKQWDLTELLHGHMRTLMERAICQGKLQVAPPPNVDEASTTAVSASLPQFEINSADWMLDEDGRVHLIECNGIPVLYDPTAPKKQALVTRGLRLYDRLYQEDPAGAVVNDSDLIREALSLTLTGKLPTGSLWKNVATIPSPEAADVEKEG